MKILLVTDGSCSAETQHGAWAAIVKTATKAQVLYGTVYPTTISRCELTPIVEGLKWIYYDLCGKQPGIEVKLISDSEYTVLTINGVYRAKKNLDLWGGVEAMKARMKIEAKWRSRNSHPYMDFCDCAAHTVRTLNLEHVHQGIVEKMSRLPLLPIEEL